MRNVAFLLFFFIFYSCIPLRIAPNIKDNKVMLAKKFKRKLPKDYSFIFEDPKDADEFYNYINIKFELNDTDVNYQVPIVVNNATYYMTFHETEIPTKTFNLAPIVIDAALENSGSTAMLEDAYISRKGHWYLVLTLIDTEGNDCLNPDYKDRKALISYLKELKAEYLTTVNYYDALLKEKP